METLGQQLRKFRKKRGMTQTELCEKVNDMKLRKSDISLYENNLQVPRPENLDRICDALKINWSIMLKEKK